MEFERETCLYLEEEGKRYAFVTLHHEAEAYNITHTVVEKNHRGEGLGEELVLEAIRFAEENGKPLKADCAFAKNYLEKKNF